MGNNIVTVDLSSFGYRELDQAIELLTAMREQGLPEEFHENQVTLNLNTNSGYVFLSNSEFQTAMMNGDSLEIWNFCSYCGEEGFTGDDAEFYNDSTCKTCAINEGYIDEEVEQEA